MPLALIIALVFVVHPLQTGSITYIVQRVESLMGLFYLATLYCAIRARDEDAKGPGPRFWTAGAILACALNLVSVRSATGTCASPPLSLPRSFAARLGYHLLALSSDSANPTVECARPARLANRVGESLTRSSSRESRSNTNHSSFDGAPSSSVRSSDMGTFSVAPSRTGSPPLP